MWQRVVIVAVIASFSVVRIGRAKGETEFYSHYNHKQYKFTITEAEQACCPKWNPETDPNPPYPAAKALEQAKQFIATVPTMGDTFWKFEELALVQASGGWAWRVRYQLTREFTTGIWPTMDCLILMDGTQIKPSVTSEKAE